MKSWRERLASPGGMLIVLPLLILVTAGGVLTVTETMARRSAVDQAAAIAAVSASGAARRTREIFAHADPVLDGLRAWYANPSDLIGSAHSLRALMAGRAGVVRAYLAWPDGRLTGVERQESDWYLLSMRSLADGGALIRSTLPRDGGVQTTGQQSLPGFDVRSRPWWRIAAERSGRLWTGPYLSHGSTLPGLTCTEAVRDASGQVVVVVAVNFELATIAAAFTSGDGRARNLLFTADRTIISVPADWMAELPRDRLISATDLRRPEAVGLFSSLSALPPPGQSAQLAWRAGGEGFGATVQAIPLTDTTWFLAQIIPDRLLTGRADEARSASLFFGVPAVLLGVLLSAWYARLFSRSKREAADLRDRAQAAEAELQQIGAYKLVRKLGEGGMGEVWLGMHRMLARPAAIKRVKAARLTRGDKDTAKEVIARFITEARITASLRSRNTIELFDYGTTPDGGFYYVMELLDGLDLRALVDKHGPLPAGRAIQLLLQACGSLAEAHDRGLVHRDIKPENLYACRNADEVDITKVLDFGIVAVESGDLAAKVSKAGFVVGTPSTMSPEQARGEPLDGRSDIYALGCVAFWLLTGTEVFPRDGQLEMLIAHLNDTPESPSQRAACVLPAGLDDVVLSCLRKSREMRPANVRELAAALRAIHIPAADNWTREQAAAWWHEHMPEPPAGVFEQRSPRSANFTE